DADSEERRCRRSRHDRVAFADLAIERFDRGIEAAVRIDRRRDQAEEPMAVAAVETEAADAAGIPGPVIIAAIERGLQALVVDRRAAHPGPVVEAHVGGEVAAGNAEEP